MPANPSKSLAWAGKSLNRTQTPGTVSLPSAWVNLFGLSYVGLLNRHTCHHRGEGGGKGKEGKSHCAQNECILFCNNLQRWVHYVHITPWWRRLAVEIWSKTNCHRSVAPSAVDWSMRQSGVVGLYYNHGAHMEWKVSCRIDWRIVLLFDLRDSPVW